MAKSNLYLRQITGNLKGSLSVELHSKTCVVGDNGSGKSAITQAMELLLTGRASDIYGRVDVGEGSELISLAPEGHNLELRGTFNDGSVASFEIKRKRSADGKQTTSKPVHVVPDALFPFMSSALPLRNFLEAVRGSPATMRRYLIGKATGNLTEDQVISQVPKMHHERYQALAKAMPQDSKAPPPDPTDRLTYVLTAAKAANKRLLAEASGAQQLADEQARQVGAAPSASDLQAATQAVEAAQAALRQAIKNYAGGLTVETQQAEIEKLRTQKTGLANEATNIEKRLAAIPSFKPEHLEALRTVIWHETSQRKSCLVCDSVLDPAARKIKADKAQSKLDSRGEGQRLTASLRQIMLAQQNNEAALAAAEEKLQEMENKPEAAPSLSILEAQTAADAAKSKLAALQARISAWEGAQSAREFAAEKLQEAGHYEQLSIACAQALNILLDGGITAFEQRVQEFLGPGDRFRLSLANGCKFGLQRGDFLHTALSGSEWTRVTAALAGVCYEPDAPCSLVILEDRAWDPHHLAATMRGLAGLPMQVIIATTIAPAEIVPGWSIVQTAHRGPVPEGQIKDRMIHLLR